MTVSTSCSTLNHCLLYNITNTLVMSELTLKNSEVNIISEKTRESACASLQDVAKSVSLHNGTSPQAGQQKGVLLSSFFQFFPCLTFSSKYCFFHHSHKIKQLFFIFGFLVFPCLVDDASYFCAAIFFFSLEKASTSE